MPLHDGDYIISKDEEDEIKLANTIDLKKIKLVNYNDFINQVKKGTMSLNII